VLAFELKLLDELGLRPAPARSELSPDSSPLLTTLAESNWEDLNQGQHPAARMTELSRYLGLFWQMHLGRLPRGREAALAMPLPADPAH